MRRMLLPFLLSLTAAFSVAQTPIEKATTGTSRVEGLFVTYRQPKANKVLLEVRPDQLKEYLFVTAIRTGLGSNDVGLDRGQLGPSEVINLRRIADKLVIEVPNLAFRANGSEAERQAVRESFAPSILWAGPVMAENDDGTLLVDISSLLLSDANDVAGTLRQTNQGTASVDASRSAIDFDALRSFPKNLEFEAVLGFKVSSPGNFVRATAPIPESWSLIQHISIIELPDDGYTPRLADPRIGAFGISYLDYSAPLTESMAKRFVARHRLQKRRGSNRPIEPIVYYVDHAAPEPIRSALVEGASWWEEAFRAAGFEGAFRVEVLPEDADPLDVRYNVIQWVHRSTRGWSYGASVTDPRTGEIIKGHVSLGSLRIRQDRMIFEGLLGTSKTGTGAKDDPIFLSLMRIRQLSAHEVGHTLGLSHNFAASSYDRGSVMDYPAPRVSVKSGKLDVSDAYGVGMGEYDKHAIKWLYSEFADDETKRLDDIARDGVARGLVFLSDGDARGLGGADPRASLWDDGNDPAKALFDAMAVREIALKNFGPDRLPEGQPASAFKEVFVPIYLYHRYQVEAAAKLIGGIFYEHGINKGGIPQHRAVPLEDQRRALLLLLTCLDPQFLHVPDHIRPLLGPSSFGVSGRETFGSRTSPTFDPLQAAEVAADLVLAALLEPTRLERVAQDQNPLWLDEMLSLMTARVFTEDPLPEAWVVRTRYVDALMRLVGDPGLTLSVRAAAQKQLDAIVDSRTDNAAYALLVSEIKRFNERPAGSTYLFPRPPVTPPGSPIGWGECFGG